MAAFVPQTRRKNHFEEEDDDDVFSMLNTVGLEKCLLVSGFDRVNQKQFKILFAYCGKLQSIYVLSRRSHWYEGMVVCTFNSVEDMRAFKMIFNQLFPTHFSMEFNSSLRVLSLPRELKPSFIKELVG